MTKLIKTIIKFYKGLDNMEDRLYGFVTKDNGSWKGCRETESKKKIVFVDAAFQDEIIPNALYKCTLVPMTTKEGFIAKTATLIRFPATMVTKCNGRTFSIEIKFGNKTLVYDPDSTDPRKRDIQGIAANIRGRNDMENPAEVAEEFISSACMVKRLYDQHNAR
ncbi:MAG: hypothetical protein NC311_11560 [Muribaculaceae bacterium]|nr:hypothetical protein [Muribaculaceae bacterium]